MTASKPDEHITRVDVERVPNDGPAESPTVAPGRLGKVVWTTVAVATGIYIFIPEPSDLLPVIGWLDEGVAVMLFTTALSNLGIHIPFLDTLLRRKSAGKASKKGE